MYQDGDFLALSGVQHFAFCERQWALIHIEQQWSDNLLTVLGNFAHDRAHDDAVRERRGDVLVVRGLNVRSESLGLSGVCDVVEFSKDDSGFPLRGEDGFWRPMPVEYKRGVRKEHDADRMQLCAQAMCLEEMFGCDIAEGCLYYHASHSREVVKLDSALRGRVRGAVERMHQLYGRRHTPKVARKAPCRSCSLEAICLPGIPQRESVEAYFARRIKELK